MKSTSKKQAGFSLIELLVSVSLFTIVSTVAIGCLLILISANAKAQNMQRVMNDLSFAIDSISREVRTGRGLYCANTDPGGSRDEDSTSDCDGGRYLSVVEGGSSLTSGTGSSRITFRHNTSSSRIERRVGTGDWYPITADDVVITDARFYVTDSAVGESGDTLQANATIFIAGYVGDREEEESSFALQTTISRRILDLF